MKFFKQRIAIILSISMIIGSVMPAFAAEENAEPVMPDVAVTEEADIVETEEISDEEFIEESEDVSEETTELVIDDTFESTEQEITESNGQDTSETVSADDADIIEDELLEEESYEEDTDLLGFVPDYSTPLYFEGTDSLHYIKLSPWTSQFGSAPAINIQYSADNTTWKDYIVNGKYTDEFDDGKVPITAYGRLYFRASGNNRSIANGMSGGWHFSSDSLFKVAGNAMSLLYEDFEDKTEFAEGSTYNLHRLFDCGEEESGFITDASELLLPATTVNEYSYYSMFNGCKYLINAPKLPAMKLNRSCYIYMFRNCTSLTEAPELPAMEMAVTCYETMFMNCTSLETAPKLPATQLAKGCYENMFTGCKSLKNVPSLPAKKLAENCYEYMFEKCDSLVNAPVILAEELAPYCCYGMFDSCGKLEKAPHLQAKELVKDCYSRMFAGCNNLEQISVEFSQWDDACLKKWVVAAGQQGGKGTFYCKGELPEEHGDNRIPNSWKVIKDPVTICFHANDETKNYFYDLASQGSAYKLPACRFHEGDILYDFKGCSIDLSAASGNPAGKSITLPAALEVNYYAIWSKNIHTVTFDANGGYISGEQIATASVADGLRVKPLKDYPVWTKGDTFTEKWYTDSLCNNEYDFSTPVTENITLYAGWTHTVEWYDETELLNTSIINHGATPSYTGSMAFIEKRKTERFAGWSPELAPLTYSKSYYAMFEGSELKYEVRFETNGGSYVRPQLVSKNGNAIRPESPLKSGYVFIDWYEDTTLLTPFNFDTPITKDTVIYAKWEEVPVQKYTITWKYKHNLASVSQCEVDEGEFPVFPGTDADLKDEGYSFYGWMENGASTIGVKPATKDATYQAMYIPEEWTYYYVLFDGAGGKVKTEYTAVPYDEEHPSTISEPEKPEREGYTFEYWYKTDENTPFPFSTPITEDMILHAKWTKNTYIIRWMKDEHTEIGITTAQHGALPQFPKASESELKKEGFIFSGWMPTVDIAIADAEYTAQYVKRLEETVVVSFDVNGGSYVRPQIIKKEGTASEPSTPSRAGFKFVKWCSDKELQNQFAFSTRIASDTVLYAKWEEIPVKQYTITWKYKHDLASVSQCTANEGTLPVFTGSLEESGYTFVGWYASGSDAIGVFPATEDMTYNAFYIANAWLYCYVLFDGAGGKVKTEYTAVPYDPDHPSTIPEPEKPERDGYVFKYWYATDENTPFLFSTPIIEDMILHAKWEKKSYTIQWKSYDDRLLESLDVKDGEVPYFPGPESELAREGFIFYGWTPDIIAAKANAQYKAKYIARPENKYVVSFFTDGGSGVLPQTVSHNGKATLPENPTRKGYSFDHWCSDAELTQEYDFNQAVTEDITLYAKWIPENYTVIWIVDGKQTQETYQYNQKPSYKGSLEKSGFVFAGWNPMLEPVSENVTYTAQFAQTHYSGGGGGGGSSSAKNATPQMQGAVNGLWTYHPNTGKWTFAAGGISYVNQWAFIANPYALAGQPAASWFYFDAQGNMLTGWQWIKGSDGITRCYFLNPVQDNTLGACFIGPGMTPDGFMVDANGAWVVNGIVQTR